MKRFYTLVAVCALTLSAFAQPELTIPFLESPPVIDGTVDAVWDEIDPVYVETEAEDNPGPVTVFEAYFKLAYNDTALFLLVYRDDDDLAFQWETGLADWQSDRDEIFFDVHVDTLDDGRGASDAGPGADYGHYQFTSIWAANGAADGPEESWSGMPSQWYHNAPFYFGYVLDGDSYFSEYAFPFESLTITAIDGVDPNLMPEVGKTFGMEVVISDVDMADDPVDESARKFLRWADISGWDSMDGAAKVTFGDDVINSVENSYASGAVTVYPSPAASTIALKGLETAVNVEVLDLVGHVVLSQENVLATTQLDVSSLNAGVYLIRINNEETIKFVKQ